MLVQHPYFPSKYLEISFKFSQYSSYYLFLNPHKSKIIIFFINSLTARYIIILFYYAMIFIRSTFFERMKGSVYVFTNHE